MTCQETSTTASHSANENRILMPPMYLAGFLILAIGLNFTLPIKVILSAPYTYLGVIPIVFGIAINFWGSSLFRKKNTTIYPLGRPTSLMTSGAFALTRNPLYLGMTAMLLGAAILLGSLIAFAFPALFFLLINIRFIPMEEKKLERIFGKDYEDYRRKVRRWI